MIFQFLFLNKSVKMSTILCFSVNMGCCVYINEEKKWTWMILANGCNITKSETFKGVWILSVPTVYIYIYIYIRPLSLAWSILFLFYRFYFYLLYNLKTNKPGYVYCVKQTETCHSTCIFALLLFCWFWSLPLSSFISPFG